MATPYMSNMPAVGNVQTCEPPANSYTDDDLMAVFKGGVADLEGRAVPTPDSATNRIPRDQLVSWVNDLNTAGNIPSRPMILVGSNYEVDMDKLTKQDAEFYNKLNVEYCFYEKRYRYALTTFLSLVTNPTVANNSAAKKILPKTKTLNNRVNLILEVMNYLAQDRVQYVNANTEAINKLNKNVNGKLETLRKSYNLLNSDNAIVTTQKEAIRYTTEKNNYTSNQIAAWAALNVVALGTIFYVYRS
jgi:hypothetical protein